jgi:hypothetical protein
MGTLSPALELRSALVSIRKLIASHKEALQKGTIVRKAPADPLLSERIDNPLRSHTVYFLEMAGAIIKNLPLAMKFFLINIDYMADREQRFANGCERNEAKHLELVAYLRKLRPTLLDIDEQFRKMRVEGWNLSNLKYAFSDGVVSKLAASSIRDYMNIVKSVVASALDGNGEQLFPRKWNAEFIDAPLVGEQNQPSTTSEGMTKILGKSTGQYRVLYALLAGCGPLRVGEALGLEIDKHISADFRTLYIRQKAKAGEIQPYLKTKSGEREVDLCNALAKMLREFVGNQTRGLLFSTSTGAQILQTNALRDSLHPVLEKLEHVKGGFNIFRRFRITYMQKSECPEALRHFWSGHAPKHVSERYTKLRDERDFRLEWVEKIGLGFDLPAPIGQLGQLRIVPKVA